MRQVARVAVLALLAGGVVALAGEAFAQEGAQVFSAAPAVADHPPTLFDTLKRLAPLALACYLIFHYMVLRPQDQRVKKHKELLDSLKRGDSVVTTGGLIGRVASVEKGAVFLEISQNVKVKFSQDHIVGLEKDQSKEQAA
jgi:preprotein translocase subunit YajC